MFEYYVLNYNRNSKKIERFNIFRNWFVYEKTVKEIRKYLRSPKKYRYSSYRNGELFGFDALCEKFRTILMSEEWSRCEYEIAAGSIFIREIKDVLHLMDREEISREDVYDKLVELNKVNESLEKWDCFQQAELNIPMIVRECIYQYKKEAKYKPKS